MGIAHIPEISLSCIELCQSCQEHILPFQEVNRNCFHTQALTGFSKGRSPQIYIYRLLQCDIEIEWTRNDKCDCRNACKSYIQLQAACNTLKCVYYSVIREI